MLAVTLWWYPPYSMRHSNKYPQNLGLQVKQQLFTFLDEILVWTSNYFPAIGSQYK